MRRLTVDQVRPALGAVTRLSSRGAPSRRRYAACLTLVCLVATLMFLLLTGGAAAWDGSTADTDWSGAGTADNPWIIGSAEELKGLANRVNTGTTYSGKYFRMGADINLENYAWVPIGGACTLDATTGVPIGAHFDGVFDGYNHTISGINVSNPASGTGAYGLFGYVGSGGVLANMSVAGSLNMGTLKINQIGGVVGYSQGSLYNLHSSVTVYMNDTSCEASMAGGIAGVVENINSSTTLYVRYCSNTGAVTGRGRVGGIVGAVYCVSNGGVVVDQCYNTGYITSTYSYTKIFSGGIVGYCRGYISNCYNWGNLETNNGHYLAGIVGLLQGANPVASLSNCYSTAVFTAGHYAASHDRWLYGTADFSPAVHITNCFWLPDPSNSDITQPYDPSGSWGTQVNMSAVSAAQLQGTADMTGCEPNDSGVFSGYIVPDYLGAADPDNAYGSYGWTYSGTGTYPVLHWQLMPNLYINPTTGFPPPPVYYAITATVRGGHGTATANPASVLSGGSSVITLGPDPGYWVKSITDNGANVLGQVVGNTYTITNVTGNHTVQVTFFNGTYTLTYSAGAHGHISGTSPQTVAEGADGTAVSAVADSGYHFAAWSDGRSDNPRTDLDVDANVAVKAIFLPDDGATTRPGDHFTIAVIPDTQYYSASYPAIFDAQTQWIADHAKSENIVFVSHLGDLVESCDSETQWQNARDSMSIVRAAGLPYSVVPGNHDLKGASDDLTNYDAYFPYTAFTGYSWYGGHFPATSNSSSYQLFSAMGQDFIMLNLVSDGSLLAAATAWANDVLTTYEDRKAIIVTHGYINSVGDYLTGDTAEGQGMWDNVVSQHANVIAVLCGHWAGEHRRIDLGVNGNTVYTLLSDYQDEPNGGNGWLRLYKFYPGLDKVAALTYSPYLDEYKTGPSSQFELDLDMDMPTVALRPGWNLMAGGPGTIFPAVLFGWTGTTYASTTFPAAWKGYWTKVTSEHAVELDTVSGPHTSTLITGWNLIGNPMAGTAALHLPSGRTAFYYDALLDRYVSTTSLSSGQGAWVKGTAGETVTFVAAP